MQQALQRFDFEGAAIRIHVDENGAPWWVLTDICSALGLSNTGNVSVRIPDGEKGHRTVETPGGPQTVVVVNEAGLYRTIFRSNKPDAERMQHWVFHEVLPSLRQTGTYSMRETESRLPVERETRYPDGMVVIDRYAHPTERHVLEVESEAPRISTELLRRRFVDALKSELARTPKYVRMKPAERGAYLHALNARMKAIAGGRGRDEWEIHHFEAAAGWLLMWESIDVRWALAPIGGDDV